MILSPETMTGVIAAIEIGLVLIILRQPSALALRCFGALSVTNMFLIAIAGSKLKTVFGATTNIGNVLYGAVMLSQAIVIARWGRRAALETAGVVFVSLVIMLLLGQTIKHTATVPGNEAMAEHINAVFAASAHVAFATFAAFIIVQYIFIMAFDALRHRSAAIRYGALVICCQVLDSAIFFGVAFGGSIACSEIINLAITGVLLKIAFAVLTIPIVGRVYSMEKSD